MVRSAGVPLGLVLMAHILACRDLPPRPGAIRVHGIAGQGELYVDGIARGPIAAQQEIGGLSAGPHTVELRRGGEITQRAEVDVREGMIFDLRIDAPPLPSAAPALVAPPPTNAEPSGTNSTAPPIPEPDATGTAATLDRGAITQVVRSHMSEVRLCYERRLAEDPQLAGQVTVTFVVSPDGHVSVASVSGTTIHDAAVEACVVGVVRRWTFPATAGDPVTISYPFVFSTSH
jgi:TonB family protein